MLVSRNWFYFLYTDDFYTYFSAFRFAEWIPITDNNNKNIDNTNNFNLTVTWGKKIDVVLLRHLKIFIFDIFLIRCNFLFVQISLEHCDELVMFNAAVCFFGVIRILVFYDRHVMVFLFSITTKMFDNVEDLCLCFSYKSSSLKLAAV